MQIVQSADPKVIDTVVNALQTGGIIVFPSDTCYGVGCDATNHDAVSRLLEYKERPVGKPIAVYVTDKEMAKQYVEINATASRLYDKYLPGALTIISRFTNGIDHRLVSPENTLGIRIPDHQLMLAIVRRLGKPLAASSANGAGKDTPYSISEIIGATRTWQQDMVNLAIDGSQIPPVPPTTVVDTTSEPPRIVRQGGLLIASY